MKDIYVSWSGGKDAALALEMLLNAPDYRVRGLQVTVNEHYGRVSMHGLAIELIERQAEALDMPLDKVWLPREVDYETYEYHTVKGYERLKAQGIQAVGSGDIFLRRMRDYRQKLLDQAGVEGVYPLWGKDTTTLSRDAIDRGYVTRVISLNGTRLDASFAGRLWDHRFIADLPDGVDPCGENGEFHSFVCDAPLFSRPVQVETGEVIERSYGDDPANRVWFCELRPV